MIAATTEHQFDKCKALFETFGELTVSADDLLTSGAWLE